VYELDTSLAPNIRPLQRGDTQDVYEVEGDGQPHLFRFEMIVGGRKRRPEFGETSVSMAAGEGDFYVLGPQQRIPLTDDGWTAFAKTQRRELSQRNARRRAEAGVEETEYWNRRHELARHVLSQRPAVDAPAAVQGMPVHNEVDLFLGKRLAESQEPLTPLTGDMAFLRRVTIDTIGTIPTLRQIDEFLADDRPDRRARVIDRLLAEDGWADNWVGYWQDVLAENPNIVNPTLNNTGPFRWWIHESFLDNKPFDRFATELIMMEGSTYYGGPAGFELATQNDVPMAAKAHIVGQAFLALEMKCARCHDAPYHDFLQQDLFSMAAMLKRGPQAVPKTSSIPGGDAATSSLLVEVTLKPGANVAPEWAFTSLVAGDVPPDVLRDPKDTRERLAALVTSPHNQRFPRVIVNRLWTRYMGHGLVHPVDDWEYADPSHPELLDYLAGQLVSHGYDLKHVARLILNSHAYQRVPRGAQVVKSGKLYLFASPIRRRMAAEQIVDSLFLAAGKPFDAGPMSIDVDGARPPTSSLHLGFPERAWQFASLSNERDRPSLALPYAQPFVTLMETFGWRSSRQNPLTVRSEETTVLQPAIMGNGMLVRRVTRLSDDNALTDLTLQDVSLDDLIDRVFLRVLTRLPDEDERRWFTELLAKGYRQRQVVPPGRDEARPRLPRGMVSWSNHLNPRATVIKAELEAAVRNGDPPTRRLDNDWRQRMEDMVWTLVNSPEFLFVP
jgi:hypothetical protein